MGVTVCGCMHDVMCIGTVGSVGSRQRETDAREREQTTQDTAQAILGW